MNLYHPIHKLCHSDRPTGLEEPAVVFACHRRLIPITPNPMRAEYTLGMDEHLNSTYIVANRSRTLYTGVTGDLRKRVFQHKWKEYEGFSAKCNCHRLVWFEHYQDVEKVIARETQLKKWNRGKKLALIVLHSRWSVGMTTLLKGVRLPDYCGCWFADTAGAFASSGSFSHLFASLPCLLSGSYSITF